MNCATKAATTLVATVTLVGVSATAVSATEKDTPRIEEIGPIASFPAEGTGGLILRDINGRDLGSGIGEDQDFGFEACGPKGSGLIRVVQLKRGSGGGWGSLYAGYVKAEFSQAPQLFEKCN